MNIFKTLFNSFFRTLGRILCYILIGTVLSLIFSKFTVHADTKKLDTIQFNESEWYINYGYWGSNMYTSGTDIEIYTTLTANNTAVNDTDNTVILDLCAGDGIIVKRTATVGNSCANSCFSQNVSVQNLNRSCVLANNSSGFSFRIFLPVNKWDNRYVTSPNSHVYLQDKITISSKNYNSNFIVYGAYLTDELVAGTNDYSEINSQINALNSNINNTNSKLDDANSKLDEAENTRKGILGTIKDVLSSIASLPGKIIDLMITGLKSLFIPEDMSFLDDFSDSISNKLGFIAEVPIKVLKFLVDLATTTWDDFTSVSMPKVNVFGVYFWDDQEIDITAIINKLKPWRYVTDVICVTTCVNTLRKWRERFTGGS